MRKLDVQSDYLLYNGLHEAVALPRTAELFDPAPLFLDRSPLPTWEQLQPPSLTTTEVLTEGDVSPSPVPLLVPIVKSWTKRERPSIGSRIRNEANRWSTVSF